MANPGSLVMIAVLLVEYSKEESSTASPTIVLTTLFQEDNLLEYRAIAMFPPSSNVSDFALSFKLKEIDTLNFESMCDVHLHEGCNATFGIYCYCTVIDSFSYEFIVNIPLIHSDGEIKAVVKQNRVGEIAESNITIISSGFQQKMAAMPLIRLIRENAKTNERKCKETLFDGVDKLTFIATVFIPYNPFNYTIYFEVKRRHSVQFSTICFASLAETCKENIKDLCSCKKLNELTYEYTLNITSSYKDSDAEIKAVVLQSSYDKVAESTTKNIPLILKKVPEILKLDLLINDCSVINKTIAIIKYQSYISTKFYCETKPALENCCSLHYAADDSEYFFEMKEDGIIYLLKFGSASLTKLLLKVQICGQDKLNFHLNLRNENVDTHITDIGTTLLAVQIVAAIVAAVCDYKNKKKKSTKYLRKR